MVVHGAHGDHGRDEGHLRGAARRRRARRRLAAQAVGVGLAVGEHQDLRLALTHRRLRLRAQRLDRRLEAVGSGGERVEGGEGPVRAALLRRAREDCVHVRLVEQRRLDAQLLGEILRGRVGQVEPAAERHVEPHDHALAQRVDGGVGHLGRGYGGGWSPG